MCRETGTHGSGSGFVNTLCNTCPTTVRITHPVHPLHDQYVSVRQTLREGNDQYYLVEGPDGQGQRIPRAWTDQVVIEPATPGARFTPHQLVTLRRWVDDHLWSASLDKEREIVPFEENSLGGNDNEPEHTLYQSRDSVAVPVAAPAEATTCSTGKVGATALEDLTGGDHTPSQHEGRS